MNVAKTMCAGQQGTMSLRLALSAGANIVSEERAQFHQEQQKRMRNESLVKDMMAMHDKDERFQMQIMVVSWGDYVANQRQIAAEQKAEQDRHRLLHKDGVSKAMFKLASSVEMGQLHVVFGCWKEGTFGNKAEDCRLAQEAERQRLKKEHDDHMIWVLLKMEDERSDAFRQTLVTVWRNVVEENKKSSNMTSRREADRHVQHHQRAHGGACHFSIPRFWLSRIIISSLSFWRC